MFACYDRFIEAASEFPAPSPSDTSTPFRENNFLDLLDASFDDSNSIPATMTTTRPNLPPVQAHPDLANDTPAPNLLEDIDIDLDIVFEDSSIHPASPNSSPSMHRFSAEPTYTPKSGLMYPPEKTKLPQMRSPSSDNVFGRRGDMNEFDHPQSHALTKGPNERTRPPMPELSNNFDRLRAQSVDKTPFPMHGRTLPDMAMTSVPPQTPIGDNPYRRSDAVDPQFQSSPGNLSSPGNISSRSNSGIRPQRGTVIGQFNFDIGEPDPIIERRRSMPNLSFDDFTPQSRLAPDNGARNTFVNQLNAFESNEARPTLTDMEAVSSANSRPTAVGLQAVSPSPLTMAETPATASPATCFPNPASIPHLHSSMSEIARRTDIDARGGFILSLIDGTVSISDIFELSAWSQEETSQILCNLKARCIIDFE